MEEIVVKGLTFVPYITEEEVKEQVKRVASEIVNDLKDAENPLFLCVLNGAFVFAADLYRECNLTKSEITFIRFKSYEGTTSSGEVHQVLGLTENIEGRDVVIVEDIVDTGVTALKLRELLKEQKPKSLKMAALLFKPESLTAGEAPEYVGFKIPSKFILGYGLDLDGQARGLRNIWVLKPED